MTTKKDAAVVAKFAEALSLCPPEYAADITDALHAYLDGDAHAADERLGKVRKVRRKVKKKRILPGQDPVYIEHNLVDDDTADAIDTNYREFS